jgi:hypothetical protein
MDAHPSLTSFGCALRASFIDLINKLSEPSSIVPWVIRAPGLTSVYVICAAFSWDGDRQPQECIEGLCEALRSLFITRRASGTVSASASGTSTPFASLQALWPLLGMSSAHSSSSSASSLSSSVSSLSSSSSLLSSPAPQNTAATTHFKVYLNDRSWRDTTKITPEYLELVKEFPGEYRPIG